MSLSVRVAPNTWWPVATLGEASRSVRLYIDSSGIGFRAWGQESAPVRNRQGKTIARISYNSRCWTPQRDWQKRTEITGADLDVEGGPEVTAATERTLMEAARHMLVDAHDEAAAIAQLAEEAIAALDERAMLGAVGILTTYDAQLAALTRSVEAARTLLLRARDGGGR